MDSVGSVSCRSESPERPVNLPFTLEIIMCLTLNSAAEWAGIEFPGGGGGGSRKWLWSW